MIFVIFLTTLIPLGWSDTGSLHHRLNYYEILRPSDFGHVVTKRGINPSAHRFNTIKEVSFKALGRHFRLVLNPAQGLLSSRFKAFTVDGTGNKKPVWVDKDAFYEGRVFGEKNTDVSAHIDDGILTAAIRTPEDTYIVEPAWRHLPDDNSSMIVYRGSDVKFSWENMARGEKPSKFCTYVKEDGNATDVEDKSIAEKITKPKKRQAIDPYNWEPVQTRCSLLLVADYRFYENMGGSNLKGTMNFLISLIDRVNKIFLETEWRESEKQAGFSGMGFVIQEVMVHTEPTPVGRGETNYNMAGTTWNVRDLLEVFSRSSNHRSFCLAHLFTDQKFDGGILGLAYVGSPRKNSVGGICSPGYVKNGHTLYLNSGLSTSRNHYGQRVITREADLVTAHGHNWGSEHDPDFDECSPDGRHGGSFLMYTYSVSGYDPNNKKFSPCSIKSVRAVLLAKANKCFSKPEESFCGNSLVEEGEECDAGLIGSEDNDRCCDSNCRLKTGAICSDKNAPCCRICQLVQKDIMCRKPQPSACKLEAFCSGESQDCPPSLPQDDGTACLDRGKCRGGECVPFCETLGLHSCLCDREEDACKRCCRPTQNSTCRPIEPTEILRDGTPCIHGYCESGECKKTVQDIVERFWDIIEDININSVMKFLNDNIVGTVVVVSLVVWIPASCLISYADKKKREEYARVISGKTKREGAKPFRMPTDKSTRVIHIRRQNRYRPESAASSIKNTPPSTETYRYYGDHNDRLFPRATYRPEPSPQHHYAHSDSEYYAPRQRHYPQIHPTNHGITDSHSPRLRPPAAVAEAFTAL